MLAMNAAYFNNIYVFAIFAILVSKTLFGMSVYLASIFGISAVINNGIKCAVLKIQKSIYG